MLKNTLVIVALLILSIVAYYLYQHFRVPDGLQSMGDNTELLAWLSLITSIVSLLTALVGLITKIVEMRRNA